MPHQLRHVARFQWCIHFDRDPFEQLVLELVLVRRLVLELELTWRVVLELDLVRRLVLELDLVRRLVLELELLQRLVLDQRFFLRLRRRLVVGRGRWGQLVRAAGGMSPSRVVNYASASRAGEHHGVIVRRWSGTGGQGVTGRTLPEEKQNKRPRDVEVCEITEANVG